MFTKAFACLLLSAVIGSTTALSVAYGSECTVLGSSACSGGGNASWITGGQAGCESYIQGAGNFSVRKCINAALNTSTINCTDIGGAVNSGCAPKKAVCDQYKAICSYASDNTSFASESACQTYYDMNNGVVKTCMDSHIALAAANSGAVRTSHCQHSAGMLCMPAIMRSFAVVIKNYTNATTPDLVRQALAKVLSNQLTASDLGSNSFEGEGAPNADLSDILLTNNNSTRVLNITVSGPDGKQADGTFWFDQYFPTSKLFALTKLDLSSTLTVGISVSRLCPFRGAPVPKAQGRLSFCDPIKCGCPAQADPLCAKLAGQFDGFLPMLNLSQCLMGKIPTGLFDRTTVNNGTSQNGKCQAINFDDCKPENLFAKLVQSKCQLNTTFGNTTNAALQFKGYKLTQQVCVYSQIANGNCAAAITSCAPVSKTVYFQITKIGGGNPSLQDINTAIVNTVSAAQIPFDASEIPSITSTGVAGSYQATFNVPSSSASDVVTLLNTVLSTVPGLNVAVTSTPPVIAPVKSSSVLATPLSVILALAATLLVVKA